MPAILIDPLPIGAPWIHGHRRGEPDTDPEIQVRALDDTTYVLRQSKARTFEAPFLYLLLGAERALLLDTGAVQDPRRCDLRRVVDTLVPPGLALLVAHTHGHGDHVAGDAQLTSRPDTVVVGRSFEAAVAGWGFATWPEEVVTLDLGGRRLQVTGIPGHHETSVAVFDPQTGTLLTGDTVYPGRLYARDPAAYVESIERLTELASTWPVRRVLGCHIEMSRDGRDYPVGSRYQPDEVPLPLAAADLVTVRDAARSAAGRAGVHPAGPAVLWNGPCHTATAAQVVRLLVGRVRGTA